jgi:hypothetical protein
MTNGECELGYLPDKNALCVVDILNLLRDLGANYIYTDDYKRIGQKKTDKYNLFERNKEEMTVTPFTELVYNKDKLNISIRSKIKGHVKINPKQADRVGLPNKMDSYIWRNQTIVKDGIINIPVIKVMASKEAYETLNITLSKWSQCNCIIRDKRSNILNQFGDVESVLFSIDLSKLPTVNAASIADARSEEYLKTVLSKTYRMVELEAAQKMYNYLIKSIEEVQPEIEKGTWNKAFTDEQIEILKDHGVDSNLCYVGVDTETIKSDNGDFYEARELEFQIKDHASLPSGKDVIEKAATGKLNKPGKIMEQFHQSFITESATMVEETLKYNNLKERVDSVKKELSDIRSEMCVMKIAKVLTGEWFDGLSVDNKGNYLYECGDLTLVIKAKKVKVYL